MFTKIEILTGILRSRFGRPVKPCQDITFDCNSISFCTLGFWLAFILSIPSAVTGIAKAQTLPLSSSANTLESVTSNVVVGIISYVTWPRPPSPFRLCIIGQTYYATGPFLNGTKIATSRILTQHTTINDSRLGADCDVVYLGVMPDSNRQDVQAELTGHPVLTIAEDDASCSDSSMFCLVFHGTHVGFAVNLDSVARSGVEVDPQVLLLGRRHQQPQ